MLDRFRGAICLGCFLILSGEGGECGLIFVGYLEDEVNLI